MSGEILNLKFVSVSNVRLRLDVPKGVIVTNFNGFPRSDVRNDSSEFTLGRIVKGVKKEAVFMIKLMPEKLYTQFDIGITLSFTDSTNSEIIINDKIIRQINVVNRENDINQQRNIDLSNIVVNTWHSWILSNALSYNERGTYYAASDFLIEQKSLLEDYCFGLPGCEKLIYELEEAVLQIDKPMEIDEMKEALNLYNKRARGEYEFRESYSIDRDIWSEIKKRIINKQSKV